MSAQNIDAVKVRGVEVRQNGRAGLAGARRLELDVRENEANGAAASLTALRPAQTPNFAATLAVATIRMARALQLLLRCVGAQFEDDLNTRTFRPATTVDAFASWPLSRIAFSWSARAEHLSTSW